MGVKDDMADLLQSGDDVSVADIVRTQPQAVRHLLPRLWDADDGVRAAAARALGETAVRHPDLAREVVRRVMWGLNDESATNGSSALIGLGEIGRRAPDLIAPYVPALVSMIEDDAVRVELLRALAAVASVAPALVAPHIEALARTVDHTHPDEHIAFHTLAAILTGERHDDRTTR